MVFKWKDGITVLSRFHWHVATIWTEPIIRYGKPSVHFTRAVHTPVVESLTYEWRYVELERTIPLSERIKVTMEYLPIFNAILQGKQFTFKNEQDYSDRIVQNAVPEKFIFELEDLKMAVVIGRMFQPEHVPPTVRDKFWGS